MPPDPSRVFREPWEAQVFALATALQDRGLFTGEEWARTLGDAIARDSESARDDGTSYYRHWLAALEHILIEKGVADAPTLASLKDAWDRAARATPHGQPIVLGASDHGLAT
jgi:nitrile hydratase accessory protein